MQTHLGPKIMHQNITVFLPQFNYSKNSFIVFVPDHRHCVSYSSVFSHFRQTYMIDREAVEPLQY